MLQASNHGGGPAGRPFNLTADRGQPGHPYPAAGYTAVDALKTGYEATFVTDAVGGRSQIAHRTAIERLSHAGAVPNTAIALVCELFRDWASPLGEPARELVNWYVQEVDSGRPQWASP